MTNETIDTQEISQDDRLWAAISWIPVTPLWPIFAIVALLIEGKKDRQFVRYHAILSLTTGVVLIPLTIVTCGIAAIIYLVFFYWAYLAYQGETFNIPILTDFARKQGWLL
ncbi:MAG: hypothetical protein ACK2UW_09035 [Anaerolineales bacterium]